MKMGVWLARICTTLVAFQGSHLRHHGIAIGTESAAVTQQPGPGGSSLNESISRCSLSVVFSSALPETTWTSTPRMIGHRQKIHRPADLHPGIQNGCDGN